MAYKSTSVTPDPFLMHVDKDGDPRPMLIDKDGDPRPMLIDKDGSLRPMLGIVTKWNILKM